jgi:hypothetical protein
MLSLSVYGASDLILLFIEQMGRVASQIDGLEFALYPFKPFLQHLALLVTLTLKVVTLSELLERTGRSICPKSIMATHQK